jgi:hypothetical protein
MSDSYSETKDLKLDQHMSPFGEVFNNELFDYEPTEILEKKTIRNNVKSTIIN